MVLMSITEVLLMLQDMIAAVADCFSVLKSSRQKSPDCVSYRAKRTYVIMLIAILIRR